MAQTIDLDPWLVAWVKARCPGLTGVYPGAAPQGQPGPFAVYLEVSFTRVQSAQGPTGLARSRVQIDVWDTDKQRAKDLAGRVAGTRDDPGLDGFRGFLELPAGRLKVQCSKQDGDGFAGFDRPEHATDDAWHRVSRDYLVWFEEYIRPPA